MLPFAIRRAAASAARTTFRPPVARTFSVLTPRLGELDPSGFGTGAKPGAVATQLEQTTGLERLEFLAKLEGKELFDMEPLKMTRMGTKKDPILVKSVDPERIVGCNGFPVDSHETIWLLVEKDHEFDRCPECGCVYKLDYHGAPEGHSHH